VIFVIYIQVKESSKLLCFGHGSKKGSKEKANLSQTVTESSTNRLISELIFRKKDKSQAGSVSI